MLTGILLRYDKLFFLYRSLSNQQFVDTFLNCHCYSFKKKCLVHSLIIHSFTNVYMQDCHILSLMHDTFNMSSSFIDRSHHSFTNVYMQDCHILSLMHDTFNMSSSFIDRSHHSFTNVYMQDCHILSLMYKIYSVHSLIIRQLHKSVQPHPVSNTQDIFNSSFVDRSQHGLINVYSHVLSLNTHDMYIQYIYYSPPIDPY